MTRRAGQGQSANTIDKERRIAAAISVSMRIANTVFGGKGYRFWHFDANAGCGWNHAVDVPGSPLVFWDAAKTCLTRMQPAAFFCDRDLVAMDQLHARFGQMPEAAGSILLPGDNEDGLAAFGASIRRSEKPHFAIGSVIVDPNGFYYRSAQGIGAPVRALPWFVQEFPRIDIILNLCLRTFYLQRGAGHDVMPPIEVLSSLRKKHWLVSKAGGQSRHLLVVGRNMPTGDHKSLGFHHWDSETGRKILNVDAQPEEVDDLFGEDAA
jgi:hypothetical protein